MFLTTGSAEMHVVNRSRVSDAVSIHVDQARFDEHARDLFPEWRSPPIGHADKVELGVDAVDRLRRRILSVLRLGPQMHEAAEADALAVRLLEHLGASHGDRRAAGRSETARRALARALEYIDGNLAGPITMTELCRYARTSLSVIEKAFRRELSMTPTQYVRTRRLNAARRLLVAPEGPESVSHVAMEVGLTLQPRCACRRARSR